MIKFKYKNKEISIGDEETNRIIIRLNSSKEFDSFYSILKYIFEENGKYNVFPDLENKNNIAVYLYKTAFGTKLHNWTYQNLDESPDLRSNKDDIIITYSQFLDFVVIDWDKSLKEILDL